MIEVGDTAWLPIFSGQLRQIDLNLEGNGYTSPLVLSNGRLGLQRLFLGQQTFHGHFSLSYSIKAAYDRYIRGYSLQKPTVLLLVLFDTSPLRAYIKFLPETPLSMMGQTSVISAVLPIHSFALGPASHSEILGTMTTSLVQEKAASMISCNISTPDHAGNVHPTANEIQDDTSGGSIDVQPATPCGDEHTHVIAGSKLPSDESPAEVAEKVVRILERYRMTARDDSSSSWTARSLFIDNAIRSIEQQSEIRMSLPAFPFKSPNKVSKVLGSLPDCGEEIALLHLNAMCRAIRDVYEHGAKLYIVSDGLMYNVSSCHYSSTSAQC